MSTPFMSEIKIISFNFAPQGWAMAAGQLLPINQNQALFSLLGTTYGGNGQTNFALPDLRGRVPMHTGNGFTLGQAGGQESHTVTISELPAHSHVLQGTTAVATSVAPGNTVLSATGNLPLYASPGSNATTLRPDTITNTGGSQAHSNMQPYSVITYIIALQGAFPSQN